MSAKTIHEMISVSNNFSTAFEGLAHPYKENIVKFGNKSVLNHPEVQEAFKEGKPSA